MTNQTANQTPTDPMYCDDCHKDLVLERRDFALKLVCGCGKERAVKVKQAFPEVWK